MRLIESWVEGNHRRRQLAQGDESFNVVITFRRPGGAGQDRRQYERQR